MRPLEVVQSFARRHDPPSESLEFQEAVESYP
jgi:hypothetical protein